MMLRFCKTTETQRHSGFKAKGNLDYLEGLLGDRAKIYPYGGHMGNIWYWQNRNDIVSVFGSLSSANESKRIEDNRYKGESMDAKDRFRIL
jgi:hypothetical protein